MISVPSIWQFIRARKQVRKRERLWELWVLDGRSWVRVHQSSSWALVMWMATGDERLRPAGYAMVPQMVWQA